jgi:hypothetical protein
METGGLMNKWKTCNHNWKAVAVYSVYGTVYQDECTECGCIGVLAEEPDEHGFYKIVAQPMADVIDLNEYRKRKEQKNVQPSKETVGG